MKVSVIGALLKIFGSICRQQYGRTESDVSEDDQTPLSKRSVFLSYVFGKGSPHRLKVGLASASL
jgi:hypothetical protein